MSEAAGYLATFLGVLLSVLQLAIFVRVLLSWFPIDRGNPIVRIIYEVTDPVLVPFQKVIPRIGMFDLSPLAALLVIQFLASNLRVPTLF